MGETPERNHGLQGTAESYWIATSPETGFPSLDGDGRADVTVIGGGMEHRTGEDIATRRHYRGLEAYARSVYRVSSVDYHWSAQDYVTADRVPYIGRLAEGHDRVFVATGFGK